MTVNIVDGCPTENAPTPTERSDDSAARATLAATITRQASAQTLSLIHI